jgi:DNA-binding transcriptional ArsR family regulator
MGTNNPPPGFDLPDLGNVELKKNNLSFRVQLDGKPTFFMTTFFPKDPSKTLDKIERGAKRAGFKDKDTLATLMQTVSRVLPLIYESQGGEVPEKEEVLTESIPEQMNLETEKEAERILNAEDPLKELEKHLDQIVCGESNNKKLLFVKALSSRSPDLSLKQFITLKGKEGSGKTRLLEMIVQTFRVKKVGRLTRHALDYLDLTNYDILVIQELGSGDREEDGLATLKFMSNDDQGYTVEVATRDPKTGEMTTQEYKIRPITVISSTIRVTLDSQYERRNDIINADESEEQTSAVLAWKANYEKDRLLVRLGKKRWTDRDFAIRVVRKVVEKIDPVEVQVPFPKSITSIFKRLPLRARGDYDKVLSTIKLYHLLLARREPIFEFAGKKVMFANPSASVAVIKIYSDALLTMLTGLEARTRKFAQALNQMGVSKEGQSITKETRDKIAKQLKKSPKTIYGSLEELYEEGYVSKTKEGKVVKYTLQYDTSEIEELLTPITKQLHLDNDIFHEMLREGFLSLGTTLKRTDAARLFVHWSKPLREKIRKAPGSPSSDEKKGENGDSSKISNNSNSSSEISRNHADPNVPNHSSCANSNFGSVKPLEGSPTGQEKLTPSENQKLSSVEPEKIKEKSPSTKLNQVDHREQQKLNTKSREENLTERIFHLSCGCAVKKPLSFKKGCPSVECPLHPDLQVVRKWHSLGQLCPMCNAENKTPHEFHSDPPLSADTSNIEINIPKKLRDGKELSSHRLAFSLNDSIYDVALEDFRNSSLDQNSVDLAIMDPPWGLTFLPLCADGAKMAEKQLKPGRILAVLCGTYTWKRQKQEIEQTSTLTFVGLKTIKRIGLRADNYNMTDHGKIEDFQILFFCKGSLDPDLTILFSDFEIKPGGWDKRYHPWGQAVSETKQIVEHFTKPGDLVVDYMTGGGTTIEACIQLGRNCVAYEIEAKWFESMRGRFSKYLSR